MASLPVTKFLTDRVAVVSASTKGIGYAIAQRLGFDGASVVVSSRKQKNVHEAVTALRLDGIEASGIVANVRVDEDRRKLIEYSVDKYGKLDILVSNAAVSPHYGDLLSISDNEWKRLLDTNVKSAFELSKLAAPHLEASGRGNIVFVSSIAAYEPMEGIGGYSITKSGLLALSKNLSQSLACRNVRVNSVAPGIIRTDFSQALYANEADKEKWLKKIPLQRFGQPEECASAVSFLVSDEASYISGESIGINGGMHARI